MKYHTALIAAIVILSVSGVARASEQSSPMGRVDRIVLRSEALGEEVTVFVRLPRGYEPAGRRYPVLYLLDAEWHFNIAAADVEFLSECTYLKQHPVPQMIVVGIASNDRNRDYTPTACEQALGMRFPTSGGSESFRRFLVDELIPAVDEKYMTLPYRILAGWSLGGLFTVRSCTGGTPEFGAFLAISPSLWWDEGLTLKELSAGRTRAGYDRPKKLVVTLGSSEKGSSVCKSTNEFMDHLAESPIDNVTVELVPVEGLGHNYSPKMAFFLGLATIFDDWNIPKETIGRGLEAVDDYFNTLSETYGFEIPVPENVYGPLGWGLFEKGEKEAAGEVFQTWCTRHPESPVALASRGSFLKETGDREGAIEYLTKALEYEKRTENPRINFVLDLERDINALRED